MPSQTKTIEHAPATWFRSRAVWRFILLRFLPLLAGFSLLWEALQLPLYTIWREASAADIAFAVVHCTLGDILIGVSALLVALIVTRAGALPTWPRRHAVAVMVVVSVGYTLYSEWRNTAVLASWAYSDLMPVVPLVGVGVSPLLQWIVVPIAAFVLALRLARQHDHVER